MEMLQAILGGVVALGLAAPAANAATLTFHNVQFDDGLWGKFDPSLGTLDRITVDFSSRVHGYFNAFYRQEDYQNQTPLHWEGVLSIEPGIFMWSGGGHSTSWNGAPRTEYLVYDFTTDHIYGYEEFHFDFTQDYHFEINDQLFLSEVADPANVDIPGFMHGAAWQGGAIYTKGSMEDGFFPTTEVKFTTTYHYTPFATGAVPEPTTWALMILGFGLAGISLRRRPGRGSAPTSHRRHIDCGVA